MARNEEKAQSMLHRYLRSRAGEGSVPGAAPKRSRRPYLATLCEDVDDAERWRRQVLSDISRKVSDIQNRALYPCRPLVLEVGFIEVDFMQASVVQTICECCS